MRLEQAQPPRRPPGANGQGPRARPRRRAPRAGARGLHQPPPRRAHVTLEAEAAATLSLAERARRAIDDTDLQTALAKVTAALGAEGTAARTDPDMIEKRRRGAALS